MTNYPATRERGGDKREPDPFYVNQTYGGIMAKVDNSLPSSILIIAFNSDHLAKVRKNAATAKSPGRHICRMSNLTPIPAADQIRGRVRPSPVYNIIFRG